jgi:hypothetical protein
MTINLSPSRLVNFQSLITPSGVQGQSLSTGLVLGTSTNIDVVTRMRNYQSLTQVGQDFSNVSPEYLAAVSWFDQQPQPTSLNIGRWVNAASAGQLLGGPLLTANQLIGPWAAIANGSLKIVVDGGALTNVAGINLTAQTNLNGVAAQIQTAIQALGGSFAAVTCIYDAVRTRFIITSGTTGPSSSVGFLQVTGAGTDISAMMVMQVGSNGAYVANGLAAESALASVQLFDNQFGGQWYNLFIPAAVDSDHVAICPYIDGATNPHFYWINSSEAAMLASGDTTHIGYLLQQLMTQHGFVQYSSQSAYAAWSAAARIATVNYAGNNTALTLMWKVLTGITPENLTASQITALESYNVNVFVSYSNGSAIEEPGICPSGQFADTIIGVDALRIQINTNVFNLLLTLPKVPQTDAGVNTLETGVENGCDQFIINGLGAPGVWNAAGFGQLVQGQFLDKGYYVYAPPIATQAQNARAARQSPPISVAFKLAGAIDDVFGTINVNQ